MEFHAYIYNLYNWIPTIFLSWVVVRALTAFLLAAAAAYNAFAAAAAAIPISNAVAHFFSSFLRLVHGWWLVKTLMRNYRCLRTDEKNTTDNCRPTRPTLSQLLSFKIHHKTFPSYIIFSNLLILRLWNSESAGRETAPRRRIRRKKREMRQIGIDAILLSNI